MALPRSSNPPWNQTPTGAQAVSAWDVFRALLNFACPATVAQLDAISRRPLIEKR